MKDRAVLVAISAVAILFMPVESRSSRSDPLSAVAYVSCEEDDCALVASVQIGRHLCLRVDYESDRRGVPTVVGTGDPDWYVAPLGGQGRCDGANYSYVPRNALNEVVGAVELLMSARQDSVKLDGGVDANAVRCAIAKSKSELRKISVNRHEPDVGAVIVEVSACNRSFEFVISTGVDPEVRLREAVPTVFP